jgi:hypothetical protein
MKTTIDLDPSLLKQAQKVLGTTTIKGTVTPASRRSFGNGSCKLLPMLWGQFRWICLRTNCADNGPSELLMYLVDTSVWIHALRPSGHSTIQTLLKPLLENPKVELIVKVERQINALVELHLFGITSSRGLAPPIFLVTGRQEKQEPGYIKTVIGSARRFRSA